MRRGTERLAHLDREQSFVTDKDDTVRAFIANTTRRSARVFRYREVVHWHRERFQVVIKFKLDETLTLDPNIDIRGPGTLFKSSIQ